MIPQEKSAALLRALDAAFGTTELESTQAMPAGLSPDLVFRIVSGGRPYLLKIMTRLDERNDPHRIFAAMQAGADAGLSPRVLYASTEDGVLITDFISAIPLSVTQAMELLPETVRRLHALPPFAKVFNYDTSHNLFIWRFRAAGLLPQPEVDEVYDCYRKLCAIYPRLDADMVSSHCDLKPENILFDGQQIWLVDWQAAFRNDRYFDLAVVANFLIRSDEDEAVFLQRYFHRAADAYERARFFLMRQAMHLFYAAVFLLLGAAGKPLDLTVKLPSFDELHRHLWAGELGMAANEPRVVYGRVHWKQLQHNLQLPRFAESLRLVAERHPETSAIARLLPGPPQA